MLYPARPGNQWVYYVTTPGSSGDVRLQIAAVEGTQAIVDVTDLRDGSTGRGFAQCDGDVILNFPLLGVQNIINNIVNGTMNMDYWAGVLAPNESAFVNSNWALSWVIDYQVYGSGSLVYNNRNFDFTISPSFVEMQCQTLASGDAAFEDVTVSAGSFRALKVICRGVGEVNANVNGSQVSGFIHAQATQWFAPRIGLLYLQSDFVLLEVFGLSIPLNAPDHAGTLELKSYQVGP
jgi:hypothetical protein